MVEQSGLQTRIAATEGVSLCGRVNVEVERESVIRSDRKFLCDRHTDDQDPKGLRERVK
jgi:hypothetical protein